MKIDLTRVITLDLLIRQKSTGSPEALAERLGVSRRTLFFTLNLSLIHI
nr:HTH domain-containing protein [Pedobacter sp. ASV19]